MTNNEMREKVMEKLDLTDVPNSLEWEDLQTRMREKAKKLGWQPIIYFVPNEPDEKVYYYTPTRSGRVLKKEDWLGRKETTHYRIQEHGQYQAEALAFLEIFKPARQQGEGS